MLTIQNLINHRHSRKVAVSKLKWLADVLPRIRVGFQMIDIDPSELLQSIEQFEVRLLTRLDTAVEMLVYKLSFGWVYAFVIVELTARHPRTRVIRFNPTVELALELALQQVADAKHVSVINEGQALLNTIDLLPWINRGGSSERAYRGGKGYDCYVHYLEGMSQSELCDRYGGTVFDVINLFAKRINGGKTRDRYGGMSESDCQASLVKANQWLQNNPDHFTTRRLW